MNTVITQSTYALPYWPTEPFSVEKPPVASVAMAWLTASKSDIAGSSRSVWTTVSAT